MTRYRTRLVTEILSERSGLQRVRLDDGSRAYNLTQLTPRVRVGERVVCNVTAVELGLGSGGWHVVHWNLDAPADVDLPGGGHIMKMRYTSLQADTGAAEEHGASDLGETIDGIPVVACSVHSQMAAVALAFAAVAPTGARLVYVMTDGAALPFALSDLAAELRERGVLACTVTAGHAFGGDLEAVNVPSALAVARHVGRADAIVVAMGPGVVGTGTRLGTTAIEVAGIVEAAKAVGGRALVVARASSADSRTRHQGLSHHTRTALELCGSSPSEVPLLDGDDWLAPELPATVTVTRTALPLGVASVEKLLAESGIRVTTMGRRPEEDPLFFRCAAAAGFVAGQRCHVTESAA